MPHWCEKIVPMSTFEPRPGWTNAKSVSRLRSMVLDVLHCPPVWNTFPANRCREMRSKPRFRLKSKRYRPRESSTKEFHLQEARSSALLLKEISSPDCCVML